jgi:hypothetical protein
MSPAVQVAASEDDGGLGGVRDATEKFHDVNRAVAANYVSFLPCFDQPGVGGMGQHYVNMSLLDTTLQPTKPEALVYEVNGARLRLVAVEYLVPISAWGSSTPPHLFGRAFFRNDTLGVWFLHAWIWRHNPMGTFANYNPKVKLCPGH